MLPNAQYIVAAAPPGLKANRARWARHSTETFGWKLAIRSLHREVRFSSLFRVRVAREALALSVRCIWRDGTAPRMGSIPNALACEEISGINGRSDLFCERSPAGRVTHH